MANFTSNRKANKLNIPRPEAAPRENIKLPFNGQAITDNMLAFSFTSFDREHKLFNLGGVSSDGTVGANWFIDLLDGLKEISGKKISELKGSKFDLHPIDWKNVNMKRPESSDQLEYWQLRLDKSSGRIVGVKYENIFYVVWLDPHHNTSDSEHYEKAKAYQRPLSTYEIQCQLIEELNQKIQHLTQENEEYRQTFDEYAQNNGKPNKT